MRCWPMPGKSSGHKRLAVLFGNSGLAACLILPDTARADCMPDPKPANGTVTCSVAYANGLSVKTNNTPANIKQGAMATWMTATLSVGPSQFAQAASD